MSLCTKQRIVKSYSVEFIGSHFVSPPSAFSQLPLNVPMLRVSSTSNSLESEDEAEVELEECVLHSNLEQEAETVLVEAQLEATQILQAAESQAAEIRQSVQEEIDRLKREVAEEIRAEVINQARLEASEIIDQARVEAGNLTERAKTLLKRAQGLFEQELSSANEQLLHLAVSIAERLTRTSLVIKPSLILDIIQALEIEAQGMEDCRLHVSPEDADWLTATDGELLTSWVKDEGLKQGDLFLECRQGLLDARIEAQLNKLEKALREELHGGLEPACQEG